MEIDCDIVIPSRLFQRTLYFGYQLRLQSIFQVFCTICHVRKCLQKHLSCHLVYYTRASLMVLISRGNMEEYNLHFKTQNVWEQPRGDFGRECDIKVTARKNPFSNCFWSWMLCVSIEMSSLQNIGHAYGYLHYRLGSYTVQRENYTLHQKNSSSVMNLLAEKVDIDGIEIECNSLNARM